MKKFRHATLIIMIASMLLLMLAACGNGNGSGGSDGDGLKIVIVTSGSSVDDGSFQQNNYEGILDFIADSSPESAVTAVTSNDIATSLQDVEAVVADYDVIVVPGFQFSIISSIALDNPDKFFILVDSDPVEIDGQTVFDNIYAMTFKEHDSGFCAGIAAAMETTTGKVAFIGGIAFPAVVNYQFGFDAGVRYANENLGTNAEIVELPAFAGTDVRDINVGGNYINDFGDQAQGKVVAEALIAEGVDILFVAAGGAGLGAFTAAKEATGVMIIGCDVDQYNEGVYAGGNVVLTSGIKNMRINVTRQLNAIADGTFKGGNYLLGADTDSTGFISAAGRHQLSADTLSALNDAFAKVKSGEIQPPGNFDPGNMG
ncbi:MAG: BMP family ABC transporter substrate-binding protein [Oscillospiraceae bacterium]|nr:BMP family ABC transporter substrate-binding protein [Oscillospiraceae bacterium]